jgi:hypothetical protein
MAAAPAAVRGGHWESAWCNRRCADKCRKGYVLKLYVYVLAYDYIT